MTSARGNFESVQLDLGVGQEQTYLWYIIGRRGTGYKGQSLQSRCQAAKCQVVQTVHSARRIYIYNFYHAKEAVLLFELNVV